MPSAARGERGKNIATFGVLMLGVLYCFGGARLAKWLFLMNGFLVAFAVTFSPIVDLRAGSAVLLGVGGGIGLSLLLRAAARFSHFIMGAILGAVVGSMINPVAMLALAAIFGVLALLFKRPVMILASSVTGGFLIAASFQSWVQGESLAGTVFSHLVPQAGDSALSLASQTIGTFVFLSIAGLIVQSLSGRLRNVGRPEGGGELPDEKSTVRSMGRRPSAIPLKPTPQGDSPHSGTQDRSIEEPRMAVVSSPRTGAEEDSGSPMEDSQDPAPEEPLGEHHATWTEDVDLPADSMTHQELIETVLAWERTAPIALAAMARFLDAAGVVQARALAVRHGVAPDHRLVTGAFQKDLGLGHLLAEPVLLEGAHGPILLEFAEGTPAPETVPSEPFDHALLTQSIVTRDTVRLSDRRPTKEQIVAALLRWERPQTGYRVVLISVMNIQDEPVARSLALSNELGIPPSALTEDVQREMGIASPVVAFFQVKGLGGTLLVEI